MKKEEFLRFEHYKKIVRNYRLPRVVLAFAIFGIIIFYTALKFVEKDPICFSSQIFSTILYVLLAISIFTTLFSLFVGIPSGGNKYEYTEAEIRLKLIDEMAEK